MMLKFVVIFIGIFVQLAKLGQPSSYKIIYPSSIDGLGRCGSVCQCGVGVAYFNCITGSKDAIVRFELPNGIDLSTKEAVVRFSDGPLPVSGWNVKQRVFAPSEQLIFSMDRSSCLETRIQQTESFSPNSLSVAIRFSNLEKKTSWIIGSSETQCEIGSPRFNETVLLLFDKNQKPTLENESKVRATLHASPTAPRRKLGGEDRYPKNNDDNGYPTELWIAGGAASCLVVFALCCILVQRLSSKSKNKSSRQKV